MFSKNYNDHFHVYFGLHLQFIPTKMLFFKYNKNNIFSPYNEIILKSDGSTIPNKQRFCGGTEVLMVSFLSLKAVLF